MIPGDRPGWKSTKGDDVQGPARALHAPTDLTKLDVTPDDACALISYNLIAMKIPLKCFSL